MMPNDTKNLLENSKIYYLTYASRASNQISYNEIRGILLKSRSNNPIQKISGLLIYKCGHFMQYLEGDEDNVNQLFEKIKCDSRHSEVLILKTGFQEMRQFADWGMAFRCPDKPYDERFTEPSEIAFTDAALSKYSTNAMMLLHLFDKHFEKN